MTLPEAWFEDEVRCGFYVPAMMKRNWASKLRILEDFRALCEKHHIRWFAGGGTLLGAARHGGFIPWDDDVDIYMTRAELERFCAVAGELPPCYSLLSPAESGNPVMSWVIMNSMQEFVDEETRQYFFGYPFQSCIDLFSLDTLLDDPELEKKRHRRCTFMISMQSIAHNCRTHSTIYPPSTLKPWIGRESDGRDLTLEEFWPIAEQRMPGMLDRNKSLEAQLAELLEAEYRGTPYSGIPVSPASLGLLTYYYTAGTCFYPAEAFSDVVMLPFEGTQLPAPVGYDAVLRGDYGEYMRLVRGGGDHDYPCYHASEQKYWNRPDIDFSLRRFSESPHRAGQPDPEGLPWDGERDFARKKAQAAGLLDNLGGAQRLLRQAAGLGNAELVAEASGLCQQLAQALGELLEDTGGDGTGEMVAELEAYCEGAYQIYCAFNES